MPFLRPTITELRARAQGDFNYRLPGTDARLRRSNTSVLATVHAGAAHGLYGHQEYIAQQISVVTADEYHLPRHASQWGVPRKAAAYASGVVSVSGLSGAAVPAGTVWQRADGAEFVSSADAVLVGGAAEITVRAALPGSAGNTEAGVELSLVTPVDSVLSAAPIGEAGIANGIDDEGIEAWRARILYRIQHPPMGGSQYDYIQWALEVAGITRAWCLPQWLGPNSVGVTLVMDDQAGAIIPNPAKIAEVAAYIEAHPDPVTGRTIGRPVTAQVTVFAPAPVPINPVIKLVPDTPETRAAAEISLQAFLREESGPGVTCLKSRLEAAISNAAGVTDRTLVSPAADLEHAPGEIPVLGAITWQ